MTTIYLCRGGCGRYADDYDEWTVQAFASLEACTQLVEALTTRTQTDPQRPQRDDPATYWTEAVPFTP